MKYPTSSSAPPPMICNSAACRVESHPAERACNNYELEFAGLDERDEHDGVLSFQRG